MKSSCSIIVFLFVFLSLSYASSQEESSSMDCEARLNDLDDAVQNMLFIFKENITEFKSIEDLDREVCSQFPGWYSLGKKYRPCLKAFPGQLVNIVLLNLKKVYKRFCLSSDKDLAFHHLQCMKPENKEVWMKVGNIAISTVNHVSTIDDLEEAIPSLCCGARNIVFKAEIILEDVCSKFNRTGSGKWMGNVVNSFLTDALDIMCYSFSSVEECSKKVPVIMTKLNNATDVEVQFNTSLIVPLVKLVNRLDGQINLQ